MSSQDLDRALGLIDAMQEVRSRNNVLWMDLVRLAFEKAPEEARAIARKIRERDREIADIFRELGEAS